MNLLYLAAVCGLTFWLTRRKTTDARQVSQAWIRQQIRERGVKGWSGAYHEDE